MPNFILVEFDWEEITAIKKKGQRVSFVEEFRINGFRIFRGEVLSSLNDTQIISTSTSCLSAIGWQYA